ncbi:hypothetical protein FOZ60_011216, partial [Perkinsus olseni]
MSWMQTGYDINDVELDYGDDSLAGDNMADIGAVYENIDDGHVSVDSNLDPDDLKSSTLILHLTLVRRLDGKGVPAELGEKPFETIGLCINYRGGPRISDNAPKKWNKPRASCDLVRREVLTLFVHFELPYRMIVVVEATGISSDTSAFRE